MNMIKKLAYGIGAFGLAAGLVACGDEGGSVSELTATTNEGMVYIDGTIDAGEGSIFDVGYTLTDKGGDTIKGAILAYGVKEAAERLNMSIDSVQVMNLGDEEEGVPGLGLSVNLAKIDSAHCGDLTLSVSVQFAVGGLVSDDIETIDKSVNFNMPCPSSSIPTGDDDVSYDSTLANDLTSVTDSVGGAKASLGSSYDFDGKATYSSKQLTATIIDEIDMIYNGTKVMAPLGTSEVGYMSSTYANSTSEAVLIPLANNTDLTKYTKQSDLFALVDVTKATYVMDAAKGGKFLVLTDKGAPVLVSIENTTTGQVMTFKYVK